MAQRLETHSAHEGYPRDGHAGKGHPIATHLGILPISDMMSRLSPRAPPLSTHHGTIPLT